MPGRPCGTAISDQRACGPSRLVLARSGFQWAPASSGPVGLGECCRSVWPGDCGRFPVCPCARRARSGRGWRSDCGSSLPGLVSLRRYVGSRNRPLAALATGAQRSFLGRGQVGAGFAGAAFSSPAGKHLGRPADRHAGPSCAALPPDRREGPHSPQAATRAADPPGHRTQGGTP